MHSNYSRVNLNFCNLDYLANLEKLKLRLRRLYNFILTLSKAYFYHSSIHCSQLNVRYFNFSTFNIRRYENAN